MDNISNKTKYRRLSRIYDFIFDRDLINRERKKAIQELKIVPGSSVLLPGIGTGLDLKYIDPAADVTGVDISPEMLNQCYQNYHDRKNLKLVLGNVEEWQDKKRYDYIILNLILSVVESPEKLMAAVLPLLKQNGRILVFDKFQQERRTGFLRRLMNRITSAVGTDITRNIDSLLAGLPLEVENRKDSLMNGSYQILVLKKIK